MQALLIIDVQNDYFPGGAMELAGSLDALANIKDTLNRFRDRGLPVFHIQHINTRSDATFFLPDTFGAEIHPDLVPLVGEELLIKHAPNSFYQTKLLELLQQKNIQELVVVGMMTHMCVDTTVRAAKDFGISITLLYDACATKELSVMGNSIPAEMVHNAYMAGLSGTFAQVLLTNQLEL